MSQLFEQFKSYTKKLRQSMKDLLKNDSINQLDIEDLISILVTDEKCQRSQEVLLGLVFNTYILNFDKFQCKLETKGMNNEQFLEFNVQSFGEKVVTYKGYEHPSLGSIKLPQMIYQQLMKSNSPHDLRQISP